MTSVSQHLIGSVASPKVPHASPTASRGQLSHVPSRLICLGKKFPSATSNGRTSAPHGCVYSRSSHFGLCSTRLSRRLRHAPYAVPEGSETSTVTADQDENTQLSPEEQLDQQDAQDILQILALLKEKRDMVFNEVRLTLMVEDPREAERKRQLGIDDETGVTREELGNALLDVYEGRIPQDRITLRVLADEMRNWPRLQDEEESVPYKRGVSPYAKVTNTGVDPKLAARRAGVDVDWDAGVDAPVQEEKSLGERLPSWMGYGVLYGISFIPIVIGVVVVVVLFLNSLQ